VVSTIGAPAPRRRRARRARRADPGAKVSEIPLTRLTVIPADAVDPAEAPRELERLGRDHDAAEERVEAALVVVNRVLRTHRVATHDPHGHEIPRDAVLAARVGHGGGEALAEGRWDGAVEVGSPERRRRRAEALRPAERLASVLSGREELDVCEPLLLRARGDLDAGRPREAALQLRIGLDALLAEIEPGVEGEQRDDLAVLEGQREAVGRAAAAALRDELSPDDVAAVSETLAICERVLRRRQILGN